MRAFFITVFIVLASCASNSGAPELENRLASWTGASVHELAAELGDPTSSSEDIWTWHITTPGMRSAPSVSSHVQPMATRRADSSISRAASSGTEGKAWTRSIDTSIAGKECELDAKVDGFVIVELETVDASGNCRFGELPLYAGP